MKKLMGSCNYSLRSVLALLLLPTLSMAKDLTVIPWDHSIAERRLAIAYGEKSSPVEAMHPSARSAPVKIPADSRNLRLIDREAVDGEGKPLSIPINMGSSLRSPLILLIPDKDSPLGLRALALDDSVKAFPWGSFQFMNATGKELVFVSEKKSLLLKAGLKPVTISPAGKSRNLEVKFYLRDLPDRPLYSSIWEYKETLRQLVIIAPQDDAAQNSPVRFKFIVEDRRDLEVEEEEP